MTDWGSHGAGSDAEIICPFVAWGAGIRHSAVKHTIKQVDVTPLMAALIGSAIPVNSVGILPTEVISAAPKYLFQAAYANLKQVNWGLS
jgi:phosphatidylinositol glycan class N